MKTGDIVRPTALAIRVIRQLKPWHRGRVLAWPDQHKCVRVKWDHKRKESIMAERYVEREGDSDDRSRRLPTRDLGPMLGRAVCVGPVLRQPPWSLSSDEKKWCFLHMDAQGNILDTEWIA